MIKPILLRLVVCFILVFASLFLLFQIALAQEPSTWNGWTILHYSELEPIENGPYTCGTGDPLIGQINEFGYMAVRSNANGFCEEWNQVGVFEAVISDLTTGSGGGQMAVSIHDETGSSQWHFYYYSGGSWSGSLGNYGNGTHTVNAPEGTSQLAIAYYSPYGYMGAPYITAITLTNITAPELATCSTVQNSHFIDTTPTDWLIPGDGLATGHWLLQNSATITDSNISLSRGGKASQRLLSILPNTTYQAVISVSNVVDPADIRLTLGNGVQIISVATTGTYTVTLNSPVSAEETTYTLENITGFVPGSATVDIDFTCLSSSNNPIQECLLIPNGGFDTTDDWLLSQAVISNSLLTLNPYGTAQQSLVLEASTSYGGVVSITNVLSDSTPTLQVMVDDATTNIDLTGPGTYQFAFTTTNQVGPVTFGLENPQLATLEIDAICVYTGSTNTGGGNCIAPLNGEFQTANYWQFDRGAEWDSPSQKAFLPFSNVALVYSTQTYSLPTLAIGENLLLSFTSHKTSNTEDDLGGIMGRVRAGVNSVNWVFETFPTDYVFETSLNTLAGQSEAEISFVNPGLEGSTFISSTADVTLDDVCIFKANRGPHLPTSRDPDAIPPVDLGFNYTSCDDVDGLLAYFGVNIQQYRAEYYAGASLWDPAGWVPWLIAAMWTILATYLCIFMAAFVTLLGVIEYLLNNFLNYGSWAVRSWTNLVAFFSSLWYWLVSTAINFSGWWGSAVGLLVTWFWLSGGNIYIFLGFLLNYLIQAALDYLSFFGLSLPSNLIQRIINGLRAVVNVLIAAWNLLWPNVGAVISEAVDLLVLLWNLLAPFLSVVWGYVSKTSIVGTSLSLFFSMVMAVSGLFWSLVSWVWANVFMVLNLPINFYYAYDNGVRSNAFTSLLACESQNFWCALLSGIDLVNHSSSHTIVYPIVIVGVIVGTLYVFRKELWALIHIEIS